jgi:hypothetical protein
MIKKLSGKEYPLAAKTVPLGSRRKSRRPQHVLLHMLVWQILQAWLKLMTKLYSKKKMKILELKNQNL